MPAPYRRGRLKKRNLISSIKKRFTGETLRQQPQNKKRCFFAFSCNTLAKDVVFFNFSKWNFVVVGTRSLSSGLDPNEKSQGYLSNTNGDSRHTSNILDSSQPRTHSEMNTLALDTNQLTLEANIWTSRNDHIFYFFGVAHKHKLLVSWSWLVLRNSILYFTKLTVGKCSNVCNLKSSISQV